MFYTCSSSLSVPTPVSAAVDVLTNVGTVSSFFATPTPYPMHDDAHCWVMCIIGRERKTELNWTSAALWNVCSELTGPKPSWFRCTQSSRDADKRDQWTHRVNGSTVAGQFGSVQYMCCEQISTRESVEYNAWTSGAGDRYRWAKNSTRWAKKWGHKLMAMILSNLNRFTFSSSKNSLVNLQ